MVNCEDKQYSKDERRKIEQRNVRQMLWSVIDQEEYQLQELLGEGTYGAVVKAEHLATGTPVAIKVVKYSRDKSILLKKVVGEI